MSVLPLPNACPFIKGVFYYNGVEPNVSPINVYSTESHQYFFGKQDNLCGDLSIFLIPQFSTTNQVFNFGNFLEIKKINVKFPGRYLIQGISLNNWNHDYLVIQLNQTSIPVEIINTTEFNVYDSNNKNINFITNQNVIPNENNKFTLSIIHWYRNLNGINEPFIGGITYRCVLTNPNTHEIYISDLYQEYESETISFEFTLDGNQSIEDGNQSANMNVNLYTVFEGQLNEINISNPSVYINTLAPKPQYTDIPITINTHREKNNTLHRYIIYSNERNLSYGYYQLNIINENERNNSYFARLSNNPRNEKSLLLARGFRITQKGNYQFETQFMPINPQWKPIRLQLNDTNFVVY